MVKSTDAKYQLCGGLSAEEYAALEADILKRGVQVPVELDENGDVLDGHHRDEIARKHGIDCPTIVRSFAGEQEKREHIRKVNLARRQMKPHAWGQIFKDILEDQGVKRGRASSAKKQHDCQSATIADSAQECGVSDRTARHRMALADAYESFTANEQRAIRDGENTVTQIRREKKEARRQERRDENRVLIDSAEGGQSMPDKARFATIVLDPPWDWGDEGDVDQLGRAKPVYGTMPLAEIQACEPCEDGRTVKELADTDCHLYLWITNRSLPKGFGLLDAWGFRYITCLTWCKPSIGMGNYFRGSTEQCLFGVKGSQPLKRKDAGTWLAAPRGTEHSEKPEAFYEFIESCSPGPFLELFARKNRDGDWTCIGAEV